MLNYLQNALYTPFCISCDSPKAWGVVLLVTFTLIFISYFIFKSKLMKEKKVNWLLLLLLVMCTANRIFLSPLSNYAPIYYSFSIFIVVTFALLIKVYKKGNFSTIDFVIYFFITSLTMAVLCATKYILIEWLDLLAIVAVVIMFAKQAIPIEGYESAINIFSMPERSESIKGMQEESRGKGKKRSFSQLQKEEASRSPTPTEEEPDENSMVVKIYNMLVGIGDREIARQREINSTPTKPSSSVNPTANTESRVGDSVNFPIVIGNDSRDSSPANTSGKSSASPMGIRAGVNTGSTPDRVVAGINSSGGSIMKQVVDASEAPISPAVKTVTPAVTGASSQSIVPASVTPAVVNTGSGTSSRANIMHITSILSDESTYAQPIQQNTPRHIQPVKPNNQGYDLRAQIVGGRRLNPINPLPTYTGQPKPTYFNPASQEPTIITEGNNPFSIERLLNITGDEWRGIVNELEDSRYRISRSFLPTMEYVLSNSSLQDRQKNIVKYYLNVYENFNNDFSKRISNNIIDRMREYS